MASGGAGGGVIDLLTAVCCLIVFGLLAPDSRWPVSSHCSPVSRVAVGPVVYSVIYVGGGAYEAIPVDILLFRSFVHTCINFF